jgi:hypothetical protein
MIWIIMALSTSILIRAPPWTLALTLRRGSKPTLPMVPTQPDVWRGTPLLTTGQQLPDATCGRSGAHRDG